MNIPKFLRKEGNALLYNAKDDSTFVFYIPANYFNNTVSITLIPSYEHFFENFARLFSLMQNDEILLDLE